MIDTLQEETTEKTKITEVAETGAREFLGRRDINIGWCNFLVVSDLRFPRSRKSILF